MSRIARTPQDMLVQLGKAEDGIAGEPAWPSPPAPSQASIAAARTELQTQVDLVAALEAQLSVARQDRDAKMVQATQAMQAVDETTDFLYGKTSAKKLNFGLEPIKTPSQGQGPPPKTPVILSLTDGPESGSIELDFTREEGATYELEWFTNSDMKPANRAGGTVSTTSRAMAPGLTPGQQYWVRVRAIRGSQKSGWSDPGTRIAGL